MDLDYSNLVSYIECIIICGQPHIWKQEMTMSQYSNNLTPQKNTATSDDDNLTSQKNTATSQIYTITHLNDKYRLTISHKY